MKVKVTKITKIDPIYYGKNEFTTVSETAIFKETDTLQHIFNVLEVTNLDECVISMCISE